MPLKFFPPRNIFILNVVRETGFKKTNSICIPFERPLIAHGVFFPCTGHSKLSQKKIVKNQSCTSCYIVYIYIHLYNRQCCILRLKKRTFSLMFTIHHVTFPYDIWAGFFLENLKKLGLPLIMFFFENSNYFSNNKKNVVLFTFETQKRRSIKNFLVEQTRVDERK